MDKKRVLITGAAGFIGFHLAKALHRFGHLVVGYDNFNSYYDPALKHTRASLLETEGVEVVKGDINDRQLLRQTIKNFGATHLVHLAAQAGVRYSLENPAAYVEANIDGFLSILEICKEYQLPLIYASSSSVYGLNDKIPFSEMDNTDRQASFYGVTKKTNELMAQTYHHLYGLSVTGLRFFTVYGPWGRPDMAYYSFTQAISEGKAIQVYNNGNMERDFTYIDDIIDGIIAALDKSYPHEIFNLGNHQPEKLGFLIENIETELGLQATKIYLPMQQGDVVSTYADISKSKRMLNFEPKVSLSEGIAHFISWYRDFTSLH